MSVVVLRTDRMAELRELLEAMGMEFEVEKHGSGPEHFACEKNGVVLEIYPADDRKEPIQFL